MNAGRCISKEGQGLDPAFPLGSVQELINTGSPAELLSGAAESLALPI